MKKEANKKGFTIIEVVLVLAIAGLIFLMVFVALPALQRSQRDTQRRQDYADLSSAIANFTTNNNGRLPAAGTLDAAQYINKDGTDPKGNAYALTVVTMTDNMAITAPTDGQVFVYTHADCGNAESGPAQPTYNSSKRAYAIYGYLETGTFCQAND